MVVAYITAKITPCRSYWVEVEFLSLYGEWRVVETLRGEAINGEVCFWICAADFRSEFTYRWRIYLPGSLEVLATSKPFQFPKKQGETVRCSISLIPRPV